MNRLAFTFALLVAGLGIFGAATPAHAQDIGISIGTDRGGFSIRIGDRHRHRCHHGCEHRRPTYHPSIQVEVQEFVGYTEERVLVGYDTEQVFVGYKEERVLVGYDTEQVLTGWRDERVLVGHRTVWKQVWNGHCWVRVRHTEEVWETRRVPCYQTRQVPRYECRQVPQYETRQVPKYECRQVPQYRTVIVTAHWNDAYQCYGYYDATGIFQRVQR